MTARPTLTVVIREVDGEPMVDSIGTALLLGIDPEDIRVGEPWPAEWIQQGRRRASEAKAHTGRSDFAACLGYWAEKERGARLEIRYEGAE